MTTTDIEAPPDTDTVEDMPKETAEQRAMRVINAGASRFVKRSNTFTVTLRNNARDLTPEQRVRLTKWLTDVFDRLDAALGDTDGIAPLDLT